MDVYNKKLKYNNNKERIKKKKKKSNYYTRGNWLNWLSSVLPIRYVLYYYFVVGKLLYNILFA